MTNQEIWTIASPFITAISNQRTHFGGNTRNVMNVMISLKQQIFATFSKYDPYRKDGELRDFSDFLRQQFEFAIGQIKALEVPDQIIAVEWQMGYNMMINMMEKVAEHCEAELDDGIYLSDDDLDDAPEPVAENPPAAQEPQKGQQATRKDIGLGILDRLESIDRNIQRLLELITNQHT